MMKFSLSLAVLLAVPASWARADAIRLHIVGPDKKPVAGALVRVLEYDGLRPDLKIVALDFFSDAAGKVEFESKKPPLVTKKAAPLTLAAFDADHSIAARVSAPGLVLTAPMLRAGDNEIALDAGAPFGGVVSDAEQKPIAGVTIVSGGFRGAEQGRSASLRGALQLETSSDAMGRWRFDSLPRAGTLQIEVKDPRYARESLELPLGAGSAPPLFLERGATIKGRLLQPDGAPAAGIALSPGGRSSLGSGEDVVTAPDGTFEMSGLRAGDFNVQHPNFRSREMLPFLIESQQVKALKVGEVRDIGNWKTQAGIIATGKIVESGTQKPVVGASVMLYGNGFFDGQTDDKGVFTMRVARDVERGNISSPGLIDVQQPLPKLVGARLDVGTIEMKRGLTVKGILHNKAGRAVAQKQIYLQSKNGRRDYDTTDEKGEFVVEGLEAGTYALKLGSGKLVAEVPIVVVAGQETAPLDAVLEEEDGADTPKKLVGIALDSAGKPVAGAKIALRMTREGEGMWQDIQAVSGADGRFEGSTSLPNMVPVLVSATRPSLLLVGGGEWKIVDGQWRTELRFQPRGLVLRGRVVNGAGAAVAHAFVSVPGSSAASSAASGLGVGLGIGTGAGSGATRGEWPIARTDENGAFALVDVAPVGGMLIVSDGFSYGQSELSASGDVKLPAPQSPAYEARALALQILPAAILGSYTTLDWDDLWALAGDVQLEAALERSNTAGAQGQALWNEYLRQMSVRDPKTLVARGDELLAATPETDLRSAAMVARLRSRSDDPIARQKAQSWLDEQAKAPLGLSAESVTALLRMASVAHGLRAGEGARWSEFAAQIAAQLSEKARSAGALEWGQLAATIDEPTLNNFIADWGAKAKFNALRGALIVVRRNGDVPAARAMLARVEAALPAAEAAQPEVRYETEYYAEKPAASAAQSRADVAELLALTDPQAAWELSKTAAPSRRALLLLTIGKNAARLEQLPLAAQALRAAASLPGSSQMLQAKAAQIALPFDPKLSDELFAALRVAATPEDFRSQPSLAAYAGARAKLWPGESRILLEREWQTRIKSYKGPSDDRMFDEVAALLQNLIGAMARVDARRALEMTDQLPATGDGRALARGKIVMALLAPAQ